MKNPFLLLVTIFFLINPMAIHSMHKLKTEPAEIDLKLEQKPKDIGTYEWVCDIASKLVKEKMKKVLEIIGVSKEYWKIFYKEIEKEYKNEWADKVWSNKTWKNENNHSEIPLPKKIEECILKAIENNNIKKLFYKKEGNNKNTITICAENTHKNIDFDIRFLVTPKNIKNLICSTDGYSIFISPEIFYNENSENGTWLRSSSLESQLGHELGHIIFKHCIKCLCLKKLFKSISKTKKLDVSAFNLALKDWWLYAEMQADIFGIFNNKKWAQDQYACHSIKSKEGIKDPNHLPPFVSSHYFKQICDSMEKDSQIFQKS